MRALILLFLGLAVSAQAEATGEWSRSGTRIGPRGTGVWSSAGEATRDDDGLRWVILRTGTSAAGRGWASEANGAVARSGEGSATLERSRTTTLDDGRQLTADLGTTVTRTEDGREWTTTGLVTGPNGGQADVAGGGSARRTADGVEWNAARTTTGPNGASKTRERSGMRKGGGHR